MATRRVSRANRNQKLQGRSWVYFAQERASGLVKIGQTRQLQRRICVLNSATAGGVDLIGSIPETDVTERAIHNLLSGHRERGEWFRPHDDVIRLAQAGDAIYRQGFRRDIPEDLQDHWMLISCARLGVPASDFLNEMALSSPTPTPSKESRCE